MVAMRESAELAKRLIEDSGAKQIIQRGQLTLHAGRGTSMSSKPVAFLLADLGVTKTHSRPTSPMTIPSRKSSTPQAPV